MSQAEHGALGDAVVQAVVAALTAYDGGLAGPDFRRARMAGALLRRIR